MVAPLSKDVTGTKYKIGDVLVQDPAFNALDIKFLRERGLSVVQAPQDAFDFTPPTSFVFLPRAVVTVVQRMTQATKPQLLLSNDLQGISQARHWSYLRPALIPFLAQRVTRTLPDSKLVDSWGSHAIYYPPRLKT